jgi:hypothetical protein
MEGVLAVILRRPVGMVLTFNNFNRVAIGSPKTRTRSRRGARHAPMHRSCSSPPPTSVGRQRSPISLLWHGSARSGHERADLPNLSGYFESLVGTPNGATACGAFSLALSRSRCCDRAVGSFDRNRNPRIHFDQFFPQLSYKREARTRVSNPGIGDWTGQNLMRRPPVALIVWTC